MPDAIIIATGSEVSLAVVAAKELKEKDIHIRVISMPCQEAYLRQSNAYKRTCIPHGFDNILAIESGLGESWYKFVGSKGRLLTIESFGLSGTGSDVMEYFGFTVKNIKKQINKLITRSR